MVAIELGPYRFKGESNWDECSSKRLTELSVLPRIAPDTDEAIKFAIANWLQMSPKMYAKIEVDRFQFHALKEQVLWLFKKPTRKPFDFLRVGAFPSRSKKLYLPAPEFGDTTALELSMAFIHYTLFAKGDTASLDKLIATLCRPSEGKREGTDDLRVPYTEYGADKMAMQVAHLPMAEKMAFLNYFEVMLEEFMQTYEDVFGSGGKSRYDSGLGMLMVLKSIAQQGHFGTYDAVCQQPVHLLWTALLDDVLTQNEQQEAHGI